MTLDYSIIQDVLANTLSVFGALVGIIVLISSTKLGIRIIKWLFPNAR
jgi:hypothetical protein